MGAGVIRISERGGWRGSTTERDSNIGVVVVLLVVVGVLLFVNTWTKIQRCERTFVRIREDTFSE